MTEKVESGANALVVHPQDDVGVLTSDASLGDAIHLTGPAAVLRLVAREPIPAGHKVLLSSKRAGEAIRKYGQVIGQLTADAEPGQHIHVHNLVSLRAGKAG